MRVASRSTLLLILGLIAALSVNRAAAGPSENYLDAQLRVVDGLESQVDNLVAIADEVAQDLLRGGNLYLAGEPGIVAELNGRAGGLCGAKPIAPDKPLPAFRSGDVVLFSDYGNAGKAIEHRSRELVANGVLIVAFAARDNTVMDKPLPKNVRTVPVEIPCDSRQIALPNGDKLIPTAAPAIAMAEWAFTAELIGACRRQGRQLAVYLSIFLDEGQRRYKRTAGLLFEPDVRPPKAEPGQLARAYLKSVRTALSTVRRDEIKSLRRGAAWLLQASRNQRNVVRNFMGHLAPVEAGTPGDVAFFTATVHSTGDEGAAWIRQSLHEGDVYFFLGYQQNEDGMAMAASQVGAGTIFFTAQPPGPQVANDPRHLAITPHWPMSDACVDLPGYDVKACPLTGVLGLTYYFAICAEVAIR
jgi:hypothetical protein